MSTTDLVFGTQYYRPPFPNRETWSSDLNLIAASGMNTVKLWAVVRLHRSLNDQILAVAVNFNHRPIEVNIGGLRQDDGSDPPRKIVQSPARDGVSFLI